MFELDFIGRSRKKVLIRIAGLMLLLLGCAVTGLAQSQPCQCKDRGDVARRIVVANAAINAYKNEIAVMKAQEAKEGKTLEFTQDRYSRMQFLIKESILQIQNWEGGNNSTAETDVSCDIKVDPVASPCMKASLEAHERIHKNACDAKKSLTDFVTGKIDWKAKETMIEVAQEEIDGYKAELAYLRALHISCEGWSGTVTFSRTTANNSGPTKAFLRTESSEAGTSYQMEITINSGNSPVKGNVQLLSTAYITTASHDARSSHEVDTQGCSSKGPPVLTVDWTYLKNFSGFSKQELRGYLNINQDGTYTLYINGAADVAAQGTESSVQTSTGWCDPEKERKANFNRSNAIAEAVRFPDSGKGKFISVSGLIDPSSPGVLRGTWTEKEPRPSKLVLPPRRPGAPTAETVITWEIRLPGAR
jgi:hypothetical protein